MTISNSTMTPVLNVCRNEVVLLPLENALVISQAKTFSIEGFDLLGIEDNDYDELASMLSLEDLDDEETKQYFVSRCRMVAGYGTPYLSRRGYEEIFDLLADGGFTIKTMISDLAMILNTWHENTPADVLVNLDIEHSQMSQNEIVGAAINAICEHNSMSYDTEYEVDGVTTLLYSEG